MGRISRRGLLGAALLSCLLSAACRASAGGGDDVVADFRLLDQQGRSRELYRYGDKKAVVLIVHGDGCPIVRKRSPDVRSLRARFEPRGVAFLMINAQDSRDAVAREADDFGLDLPILIDEAQVVAPALGITRTAEALLIDPRDWRVAYRGEIDDRLSFGAERDRAAHPYLADAIEALIDGRPIAAPRTEVFGCLIPWRRGPEPRYASDVAPLLASRCLRCHSDPAGPAPLRSHEDVVHWSPMIRETLLTGRMPPWGLDPGVGRYEDYLTLGAEQTRAIVRWIEAGSPRGGGHDPLARAAARARRRQRKADLVLDLGQQSIPESGVLPYRYLVALASAPTDLWLDGVIIRHDDPRVVHHHTLYVLPQGTAVETSTSTARMAMLPFDGSISLFALSPGQVDVPQRVPRGARLLLEVHYTPSGKPESDHVKLLLYLHHGKPPARSLERLIIVNTAFEIPPYASDFPVAQERKVSEPITVYGFQVHMHGRGHSAKVSVRYPDGRLEALLSVPYADFLSVKAFYQLRRPKRLPAGSTLIAESLYDNSASNPTNPDPSKTVKAGYTFLDEMFAYLVAFAK